MSLAFLFPGQGSQTPGMLQDFYNVSPEAKSVIDEATSILGTTFLETLFTGPEDAVRDTRMTQPALVTAGIAIAAHLNTLHISPTVCAGHSIGEIAALAVANVFSTGDAIRITQERARLMAEESPEGTMAAVMGMKPEDIAAALPEGAEVANFNGPQQTIISGTIEGIEAAKESLKEAGAKRVIALNVSGPFHSSCMIAASEKFKLFLDDFSFATPECTFVSSVTGKEESDPDTIKQLLWQQLYSPVRWTETMETIGATDALEVGPGKVLQGIARRIDGAPSISAAGTLDDVAALQTH